MKRITGLVLVKETGLGVPNLVVAVFDSELTSEDFSARKTPAQVLQSAGRRLSSVLTDGDGRFCLSTEDLEFSGNEPRPDLLLMALAPEDVQDLKRPFPLSTEERILYVSTVPRVDAGAEEAYVIRLLQAQVDRFQIPTGPQGRDTPTAIRELSDPVLRAFDIRDGVRERLSSKLLAEQEIDDKARQLAKTKIQNLSALPPHMRDEASRKNALLIRGKSQLTQDLPRLQQKAITDGLARIKSAEKTTKTTMRLRLTKYDLDQLGLSPKGSKVSGRVTAKALSERVRSLVNVLDLVRARDIEPPSAEELERRYLNPSPTKAEAKTSRSKRGRK